MKPDNPTPQPIPWLTPQVRRYGYAVLAAGVSLATVYGYLTQDQAAAWLTMAMALTGLATAAIHVPGHEQ